MAIKTKKITELGSIELVNSYLLGTSSAGVTGKIPYNSFTSVVNEMIETQLKGYTPVSAAVEAVAEIDMDEQPDNQDIKNLQAGQETLSGRIADLAAEYKKLNDKYNSYVKSASETQLELVQTISDLTVRVTALESFVQALQKDGYLTLKEIQRAAADACPICNHTHEEETSAAE